MAAHDTAFDKIMEMAGNDGPFQQRFNYIFNGAMVVCGAMSYMNIILALIAPDHWCHVPGRTNTNYSIDQWKQLTLPRYAHPHISILIIIFMIALNFNPFQINQRTRPILNHSHQ